MLSNVSLFSELEPDDLELIVSHGKTRIYAKNTVIIT